MKPAFHPRPPRSIALPAIAALVLAAGSGCATERAAYAPAAVATHSPRPQVVGALDLYAAAERFVAEHPGTDFRVGTGNSMTPLYGDHTVIITQRLPLGSLIPGMTVVFFGDSGLPVAHVLVRKTPEGWIARGIGNPRCDSQRVGEDNYVAAVVGAFESTGEPMQALIRETSDGPGAALATVGR